MKSSQILNCPICLNQLTDPHSLSCGHTMCIQCLEQMIQKQQFPNCPLCRKPILSPINETWTTDQILVEIISILNQDGEKKLKQDILTLVICLDCGLTPIFPIVLGCQHLFCEKCIAVHLMSDLICPACNEWATFIPQSLPINTLYQELIEWFNSDSNEMIEEVQKEEEVQKYEDQSLEEEKIGNLISGMPIFFYDQLVHIKQKLDLMIVEDRYIQMLKIISNGSGHFPIVTIITDSNLLPIYADFVKIEKTKIITKKQIYVQVVGIHRVIIKEIYSYDPQGEKINFSLKFYKNLPGQLWMCNFEILDDQYREEFVEMIYTLWYKIQIILTEGFSQLNSQLKEIFLPSFQIINLFSNFLSDKKDQYSPQTQLIIQQASLILLRLLKIPLRDVLNYYYNPDLLVRLQYIIEYLDVIKTQLAQFLGIQNGPKTQPIMKLKNTFVQSSCVRIPFIDIDSDDENQDLQLLQFKKLSFAEHIFMNMFKIEQVASQITE